MNDLWLDVAAATVADATAELRGVREGLSRLPAHAPARAALALRAGDLAHRIAAASRVLDAYAPTLALREAA